MRQYIKSWITEWDIERLYGERTTIEAETIRTDYTESAELQQAAPVADRTRSRPAVAAPGEASQEAFGLDWPHPLFGYQRQGIQRLLSSRTVLLADEMGLGKTIQAIAALRILAARREIERALIVCPIGLIAQWRRQIRIWGARPPRLDRNWRKGRTEGGLAHRRDDHPVEFRSGPGRSLGAVRGRALVVGRGRRR